VPKTAKPVGEFPAVQEARGPFKTYPSQYIREKFLQHVRDTGQPDSWEHHDPSRPPRDKDYIEVLTFGVPEQLREKVGMASCPICSPLSPKYFEGVLAWFRHEGVLRAIGHECAKGHFGNRVVDDARRGGIEHDRVERAQDFLIDYLPKVTALRNEISALQEVCRDIEHLKQSFYRRLGKTTCQKIARDGASGELPITIEVKIMMADRFGKEREAWTPQIVESFPVNGLNFLKQRFSAVGQVQNTLLALGKVRAADPYEALEFVTEELTTNEYLFEAETLARASEAELQKLRKIVSDAKAFFEPANLESLSRWTLHEMAEVPIEIGFDKRLPAVVTLRKRGRPRTSVPIRPSLRGST
tara:strand:- start:418 stop:1488 length:1071 start_codon:yes stop_codon:yes gene_type:complete